MGAFHELRGPPCSRSCLSLERHSEFLLWMNEQMCMVIEIQRCSFIKLCLNFRINHKILFKNTNIFKEIQRYSGTCMLPQPSGGWSRGKVMSLKTLGATVTSRPAGMQSRLCLKKNGKWSNEGMNKFNSYRDLETLEWRCEFTRWQDMSTHNKSNRTGHSLKTSQRPSSALLPSLLMVSKSTNSVALAWVCCSLKIIFNIIFQKSVFCVSQTSCQRWHRSFQYTIQHDLCWPDMIQECDSRDPKGLVPAGYELDDLGMWNGCS